MSKFTVNAGYGNESKIEAVKYAEEGSFVNFYNGSNERVASVATTLVKSVDRDESE